MSDGVTYWQIRHKQDPKRNVWVSGCKGLCDTPEIAMKIAQDCGMSRRGLGYNQSQNRRELAK